ncbi:MAG: beta-N-acetylhexosaminidase [Planctomycetaceae bacterium]|jgi:hexosaminidase|nr:beta-N-acetylhexosaminidase [Planctomycetaceae bacterium]
MLRSLVFPLAAAFAAALFSALSLPLAAAAEISIIPAPRNLVLKNGTAKIISNGTVVSSPSPVLKPEAEKLQQFIKEQTGAAAVDFIKGDTGVPCITIIEDKTLGAESYRLNISPKNIEISAADAAGAFYAGQTLLQLIGKDGNVPCLEITDAPRFAWRGLMIDIARHFFGKEILKEYITVMSRLKMNRLHLHLTDEAGWRLEIKRYPKLTETGAVGNCTSPDAPRAFLTQDDVRELVKFAEERHVMIVPEIEMPGHFSAAFRSYPELADASFAWQKWQGFVLNPSKPEVYEFIENVLKETAALFPSPYIHLGCDEVSFAKKHWEKDAGIQQFMKEQQIADLSALEHYFIRRAAAMVKGLNKTTVGWDEIIPAKVPPKQSIVMNWRSGSLAKALNAGYRVILTPNNVCYLDYIQHSSHNTSGRGSGGKATRTIEALYKYPDSEKNIPADKLPQIVGIQANMWTDICGDNRKRLDFMVFPRAAALAESAWTPAEKKNKADFDRRLRNFMPYLDAKGIYYFNPFEPEKTPEPAENPGKSVSTPW